MDRGEAYNRPDDYYTGLGKNAGVIWGPGVTSYEDPRRHEQEGYRFSWEWDKIATLDNETLERDKPLVPNEVLILIAAVIIIFLIGKFLGRW